MRLKCSMILKQVMKKELTMCVDRIFPPYLVSIIVTFYKWGQFMIPSFSMSYWIICKKGLRSHHFPYINHENFVGGNYRAIKYTFHNKLY